MKFHKINFELMNGTTLSH